jgi:hypothetical protein
VIELIGVFGGENLTGAGIEKELGAAGMSGAREGKDRYAKR